MDLKARAVKGKVRLDQALVELGFAPSREKARAMILAGEVYLGEERCLKPSRTLLRSQLGEIRLTPLYTLAVGRGKQKITPVLEQVAWNLEGALCLDVGASTGGFTEALLERGACCVWAVDVGRHQLHERLRKDPRVVVREGVNFRYFSAQREGVLFDYAVMDVSFISVTLLLAPLSQALKHRGEALILFKPQFEVGRGEVGKGGVVRNPEAIERAQARVRSCLEQEGFTFLGAYPAGLPGKKGNQEIFLHVRKEGVSP